MRSSLETRAKKWKATLRSDTRGLPTHAFTSQCSLCIVYELSVPVGVPISILSVREVTATVSDWEVQFPSGSNDLERTHELSFV